MDVLVQADGLQFIPDSDKEAKLLADLHEGCRFHKIGLYSDTVQAPAYRLVISKEA